MIKSQEELNMFVEDVESKLEAVTKEAAKVGDIEMVKTETEELKAIAENLEKRLEELKEQQVVRYISKSEDERAHEYADFMLACARQDYEKIKVYGGKVNAVKGQNEDWKPSDWSIKAAPDLGTPLRGDAVTGSILVPEQFASEVLRIPEDGSGMMGKVRTIPMSMRKINFPKELAGVSYTWVTNEVTAKTEQNPTFEEVELECETAAAWVAMTEEFMEDSMVDMSQYLSQLFREAWWKEFDTQVLTASAAPFTGILEDTDANIVTMGTGKTSFSDADFDDIVDLVQGLDTQAKRAGASFIMHATVLDNFKKIKDDNGNPIYANPGGTQPQTLYGYPIIFSDAMPDNSSSAESTPFVAFGNPKHLLHGNRKGLEFRFFNQTADTLVYDRNFFRVRLRQGFVAGNPEGFSVLKTPAS
jgi:HK97 family phage major capsid protein